MQRHICSLQVSRMCGAHALSAEHLSALYTAFTLHYEHGLNAFGIDMLPTDMGLSDAYALLAGELGQFRHSIKINAPHIPVNRILTTIIFI